MNKKEERWEEAREKATTESTMYQKLLGRSLENSSYVQNERYAFWEITVTALTFQKHI